MVGDFRTPRWAWIVIILISFSWCVFIWLHSHTIKTQEKLQILFLGKPITPRGKMICHFCWGGGHRGYSALRFCPLPFYTAFSQKRYPFHIPSTDKWHHFHIPSLELCILFNCCKCTVFQVWINHKIRFCRLFHSHKKNASVSPFCPFYDRNDKSPYPLISTVKSLPFHIPEAWKRYPFRAEPPPIGYYKWGTSQGSFLTVNGKRRVDL